MYIGGCNNIIDAQLYLVMDISWNTEMEKYFPMDKSLCLCEIYLFCIVILFTINIYIKALSDSATKSRF